MDNWEYWVTTLSGDDASKDKNELDEFGKDGWELVCVIPSVKMQPLLFAYFKRPKK